MGDPEATLVIKYVAPPPANAPGPSRPGSNAMGSKGTENVQSSTALSGKGVLLTLAVKASELLAPMTAPNGDALDFPRGPIRLSKFHETLLP